MIERAKINILFMTPTIYRNVSLSYLILSCRIMVAHTHSTTKLTEPQSNMPEVFFFKFILYYCYLRVIGFFQLQPKFCTSVEQAGTNRIFAREQSTGNRTKISGVAVLMVSVM